MNSDHTEQVHMVVFDWAGTVADFGCFAPIRPFQATMAAMGIEISIEQARGPMGLAKRDHLRELFRLPEVSRRWHELKGRMWTEDDVNFAYDGHFVPMQLGYIDQCNELVPGLHNCLQYLNKRDIKVATTTGYFKDAAEKAYASARSQGFIPDCSICPADVPAGRPAPWMIYRSMETLGVYPAKSVIKVGDTLFDIEEGLNAGAWAVGVTDSSSEIGLSQGVFASLTAEEQHARTAPWAERLRAAGAHAVISTVADLPNTIEGIEKRLADGEKP